MKLMFLMLPLVYIAGGSTQLHRGSYGYLYGAWKP